MINAILRNIVKFLLWLRYRIKVSGLKDIRSRGNRSVLFLPSHPALIDPFVVISTLSKDFFPRVIANNEAVNLPIIKGLAERFGTTTIPGMAKEGPNARSHIELVIERCIAGLKNGENWIIYPAGHILTSRYEELGGNSAIETILKQIPDLRVVLLRDRGLWGSGLSRAKDGRPPNVGKFLIKGFVSVLLNGIFFTPRRNVTLEFFEPVDLPRTEDRKVLNRYLEAFYNLEPVQKNTYVPYTIWERGGIRELPDPERSAVEGSVEAISSTTREIVISHLMEITGHKQIKDTDLLAIDLGMDSLIRSELMVWIEQEFGFPQGNSDSLRTVAEVLLAAGGEAIHGTEDELKPVPDTWFKEIGHDAIRIRRGRTIAEAFLAQAKKMPDTPVIADQTSGVKTYREIITSIFALLPQIKQLPGENVGIMLPASVIADIIYLAVLFAGKVPVMVNWTVGTRNMRHSLDLTGVKQVITAQRLLKRLELQGADLTEIGDRFLSLETLAPKVSSVDKLLAWLHGRFNWSPLARAKVSETAAVLFTSGSESLPKAVPLSHTNLLANLNDVLSVIDINRNDRMLGMLPPFHSFGLTANMLLPLCTGLQAVYHSNPTEGPLLARITEYYRASLLIGTPTFLYGIIRSATREQLATLRLAVTGAEECPQRVYSMFAERCPDATIIEGYGITECSPIVSVNYPTDPKPSTIGYLMGSLEAAIVNVDTLEAAEPGTPGLLLLRGPSIFNGYLGDAPNPFVDFEGRQWYRTGDLVSQGSGGILTFRGRLKRFVKIGGEMISLPAIENILVQKYSSLDSEGPNIALIASVSEERPELVLFTTLDLSREEVNQQIREAGLSPLHNIRQVIQIAEIPTLGTGKTDYRNLQQMLEQRAVTS